GLHFLQTLANLGLGYTLRNIRHDCVTKDNVDFAKSFLKTVDTDEGWQQMEVRWRMSFYMANAKICFVQQDVDEALELANKALELSNGIHFKEEHENIQEFIRFISKDGEEEQTEQENKKEVQRDNKEQHEPIEENSGGHDLSTRSGQPQLRAAVAQEIGCISPPPPPPLESSSSEAPGWNRAYTPRAVAQKTPLISSRETPPAPISTNSPMSNGFR
ncbi:MAG: hypothetical protein ACPGSE_04080, partial [Synechococcus sp.]